MERVEVMMQGPMSNTISVRLRRDVSTFAFFFFAGLVALFMDQSTPKKHVKNVFAF